MTRQRAIKMLKNEKEIVALDLKSYLNFLALAIEIGTRDLTIPLARITKGYWN